MKTLPPLLNAHIQSGTTTLCWCWRLTRRDGGQLGFTDHDRPLTFDGTAFEAASGFTASEMKDQLGFGVDNVEVTGAISSDRLDEADLRAGIYDDAKIEIFRVNWQDVEQRVLMRTGTLGEVSRAGKAFSAEVRGLSHYLQQPKGRLFQYACDADLGDHRCTVNLAQAAFKASASVLEVYSDRSFSVTGLAAFESDWFTRGLVVFTSGSALNQAIEVKSHRKSGELVTLELWQAIRQPVMPAQTFTITAGCDKALETCRAKFSNTGNFRGFPHMPGNDFVMAISRPGRSAN